MSAPGFKQVRANNGYYINVGDMRTKFFQNNGTDAAPSLGSNYYAANTVVSTLIVNAGGAVFRDHGKTLTSSGRTFRKVQLMLSTGVVYGGTAAGTDGVAGLDSAPSNYVTGYIELPGSGGASSGLPGSGYAPVARLG